MSVCVTELLCYMPEKQHCKSTLFKKNLKQQQKTGIEIPIDSATWSSRRTLSPFLQEINFIFINFPVRLFNFTLLSDPFLFVTIHFKGP